MSKLGSALSSPFGFKKWGSLENIKVKQQIWLPHWAGFCWRLPSFGWALSPFFSLVRPCTFYHRSFHPPALPFSLCLSVSIGLPPSLPHVLFSLSCLTLSLSFKLFPFLCLFLSHPVCLWETAAVHQDHSQTWFMMPIVLPKTECILVNLSVINLTTCALSRLPPHCSTVLLYFYTVGPFLFVACFCLFCLFVCLVACFFLSHLLYFSKCPWV